MYSEYGKVVVGYQGIGKSTLAFHNNRVIDLESSHFFVGNERVDDWYIPYCNIARALCRQGYIVCISTLAEFWELITYPDENEFLFDLQYIYPLAVRYFYLPYTVTYRDKNEEYYGLCCNSDEEIISSINKSIKECEK